MKAQIDLGTPEEEIFLLYQNLANLLYFQLRSAFFSKRFQLLNSLLLLQMKNMTVIHQTVSVQQSTAQVESGFPAKVLDQRPAFLTIPQIPFEMQLESRLDLML